MKRSAQRTSKFSRLLSNQGKHAFQKICASCRGELSIPSTGKLHFPRIELSPVRDAQNQKIMFFYIFVNFRGPYEFTVNYMQNRPSLQLRSIFLDTRFHLWDACRSQSLLNLWKSILFYATMTFEHFLILCVLLTRELTIFEVSKASLDRLRSAIVEYDVAIPRLMAI